MKEAQIIELIISELELKEFNSKIPFREVSGWSSLTALILVSRIQEQFGVVILSTDLALLITLEDLIQFILK
jgi:acyl carrier protein